MMHSRSFVMCFILLFNSNSFANARLSYWSPKTHKPPFLLAPGAQWADFNKEDSYQGDKKNSRFLKSLKRNTSAITVSNILQ